MNKLTITTNLGDLTLNMPDNLNEITFEHYMTLQDDNLTNFEIVALLTGTPVDELYDVPNYAEVNSLLKTHLDMLLRNIKLGRGATLPKKICVYFNGKALKIKLPPVKDMLMGCFFEIKKIIEIEILAAELLDGDQWHEKFQPATEAMAKITNCFLCDKVSAKSKILGQPEDFNNVTLKLPAGVVICTAKYFFNLYPNLPAKSSRIKGFRYWLDNYIEKLKKRGYEYKYARFERKELAKMKS